MKRENKLFSETYSSIQLSFYYCLYYDEDFSKQQIKNFNKFVGKKNSELATAMDIVQNMEGQKLDFKVMVNRIPARAKMQLKKRVKGRIKPNVALDYINDAILTFSTIAISVLREHYHFSYERILKLWDEIIDFMSNYSTGMQDSHVIKYFIQECGLVIEN